MPLDPAAGWAPDLERAPRDDVGALYLNYPSNPCAACVPDGAFEAAIEFAEQTGAAVMHDFAYGDLVYDGRTPRSFLATPGAREVGIELFSFSKTYGMAGWRLGFALGNAEIVARLNLMNDHVRAGIFRAMQEAGIAALTGPQDSVEARRALYETGATACSPRSPRPGRDRRAMRGHVLRLVPAPGRRSPRTASSTSHRVALAPGEGFGETGRGWARISLATLDEPLDLGLERLARRVRLKPAAERRTVRPMLRGVVAATAVLVALALAPAVSAKTYKVTTRSDHAPGACTAGDCTLREAIRAANATLTTADTIVLPSTKPYKLTIPGIDEDGAMTGDLDITNHRLRIVHPGKGKAIDRTAAPSTACSRSSSERRPRSRSSSSATGTPRADQRLRRWHPAYAKVTLISGRP